MRLHYLLLLGLAFAACSNKDGKDVASATTPDDSIVAASTPAEGLNPVDDSTVGGAVATAEATAASAEHVGSGPAHQYYTGQYDKKKSYIVISKRDLRLYVYADVEGEPRLLADYPCCLSRNKGQKQRRGDNKTPESPAGKPFKIQQIQDASSWRHDFHDGRGNILAYGHWFLRLQTPGHTGIGIHGSTNNESSVPGRASEGCIRLLDKDIIHLKETYAFVGMPVTIQAEGVGHLPFMDKAKKDEPKAISYRGAVSRTNNASTDSQAAPSGGELPTIQDPGEQYHSRR